MSYSQMQQKIENLENKVKELEVLNTKVTLTNDIKYSLGKYIESNEKFQKKVESRLDEVLIKGRAKGELLIEYKWVFFFSFLLVLGLVLTIYLAPHK